MPADSLLAVVEQRYTVAVDHDSDGGRILGALTPDPSLSPEALTGTAAVAPLTLVPTPSGVTVRAAGPADPLVLTLPAGPLAFKIVPAAAAGSPPRVEVTVPAPTLPAPFLRPAEVTPEGTLKAAAGSVELHLPNVLVVVVGPEAHLAPSTDAGGALPVTMTPPAALIDPAGVVGFSFQSASLNLDAPGGAEIKVPDLEVYVSPPGLPAFALHGGGHNLRLGMGPGDGLSGDFQLVAAGGPAAAARPRFLKSLAAHLRLNRGAVTLLELTGSVDLAGEVAARVGPLGDGPSEIGYRLGLTLDGGWRASLSLTASGGGDYLWRTQAPGADTGDPVRNTLGAYAVFAPLLASNLPVPGGGYVDLAIGAGAAVGLAESGAVSTHSVVLHGAELVLHEPQGAAAPEAILLFDLETELQLKVELGSVSLLSTKRPFKVRHKAIGLRLDFGADGGSPQLNPVFDPTKGFSLDLADPGLFAVPDPLGDFVEPQGARVARENPLNLDIDLVLKADLGIVTVDRSTVRIPLDPPGPPSITALGAHVDVPGALSGGGYLRLEPGGGFAGSLDAALVPPIGVRAAAGLEIQSDQGVDSVLVTLDVGLPVPIPLANSGLGLFGFLGLLGVNFERKQDAGKSALDWFVDTAQGEATRLEAWRPKGNHWAIGLGAVIGTIEGGFLFNAKGMVVIELPGPSVLLVMKANILNPRPPVKASPDTGVLLAVIEIRPPTVTIGVVAEYKAQPLIELRAPAEAFFDFSDPKEWRLDIGGLPPKLPVSVKFLFTLSADGYLMLHGNGIKEFKPKALEGFSVAAGVHAALTWGPEPIGLYLRISAAASVGISFKPVLIIGTLELRGELHLFIVSIEASADAKVQISEDEFWISAEVCGSVDFFFFDVSGCVKVELGSEPTHLPPADPLVRALSLHGRSRPMLHGTASEGALDGSLGDAAHLEGDQWIGELPVVPIDAIPVLQLDMRPDTTSGCKFLGNHVESKLAPGQWLKRGQRFYRYTLTSIDVSATGSGGAALPSPVTAGEAPSVWWDRYGKPSGGDDNDVQLALLTWTPDPTPAAAEHTVSLDERVTARWGDICAEAAGPAPVLWSFNQEPLGPSRPGWTLQGTPLPDQPGTVRSAAPSTIASVTEPWRSGGALGDGLAAATPAFVFGGPPLDERAAGHLLIAPRTGTKLEPAVNGPNGEFGELFHALHPPHDDMLGDAVRLDAGGLRSVRLLLFLNGRIPLDGTMVVRPLDADGNPSGSDVEVTPNIARSVPNILDLPDEWIDPDRPWRTTVLAARAACSGLPPNLKETLSLQLLTTDLPEGTAQIELGLVNDVHAEDASWGLLVIEAVSTAEWERSHYDTEDRQRQIDVVNGFLGADDGKRALLHPDATYTVALGYDVDVTGADEHGNADAAGAKADHGRHQSFSFKTAATAPARLDPWVLATDPGPAEEFFFYGDPLRVVFSTSATRKLFETYGSVLSAVARAASGKHPDPTPTFDDVSATSPFVLLPFGAALLGAVSGQPCIDRGAVFFGHQRSTLTIALDPLTEYILDIQVGQPAAPPTYPLFRRRFSTSRYKSFQALAQDVAQTPVRHRRVANSAPLAALAAEVADRELEDALRAVRWGELTRPAVPRVTVIWRDPAAPSQHSSPAAVLLETPEPLWRRRDSPEEVTDANGTRRYQLRPWQWLGVVETPPGDPIATRFVQTTDGARTLVILDQSVATSGGTLSLGLRRTHHPLFEGDSALATESLCAIALTAAAPWEVAP
jgi:hypothetical protein